MGFQKRIKRGASESVNVVPQVGTGTLNAGVSAFIAADLSASSYVGASYVTPGAHIGTLVPTGRVNAPAANGGGFKISSLQSNGSVLMSDTSGFAWIVVG